jgi:hypothetical protein
VSVLIGCKAIVSTRLDKMYTVSVFACLSILVIVSFRVSLTWACPLKQIAVKTIIKYFFAGGIIRNGYDII